MMKLSKASQMKVKKSLEKAKESEIHLLPQLGFPQKHQTNNHSMYVSNLVQTYTGLCLLLLSL